MHGCPGLGLVGGSHIIFRCAENLPEGFVLDGFPDNLRHVPGRGQGLTAIHTVDGGKLRSRTADLLHPLVHQRHKALPVAGDMLRQHHRRVVGIGQQQTVEQIPNGYFFFTGQIHGQAAHRKPALDTALNDDHIIQLTILQRHNGGNHLGKAAGRQPHIRVEGIDHRIRVHFVQKSRLGGIQLLLRPGQRDFPINGTAAAVDAHGTELRFRGGGGLCLSALGLPGLGSLGLGGLSGRSRKGGHLQHQHGTQEQRNQTLEFFHILPSRYPCRTCPAVKNRV